MSSYIFPQWPLSNRLANMSGRGSGVRSQIKLKWYGFKLSRHNLILLLHNGVAFQLSYIYMLNLIDNLNALSFHGQDADEHDELDRKFGKMEINCENARSAYCQPTLQPANFMASKSTSSQPLVSSLWYLNIVIHFLPFSCTFEYIHLSFPKNYYAYLHFGSHFCSEIRISPLFLVSKST